MKAASLHEIKQELTNVPTKQVLELCLRLTRFKKENKELLTYLLFEAHDQHGYIESIKKEIDEGYENLPSSNNYLLKKSLRKVLRTLSKYARFTSSKQSEAEMLIHFCIRFKSSGILLKKNTALTNLYNQQLKKINTLVQSLHEDLHYDFKKQLEQLL